MIDIETASFMVTWTAYGRWQQAFFEDFESARDFAAKVDSNPDWRRDARVWGVCYTHEPVKP